MGINKKTLGVSKTNLGLGNVANLSPAEIAAILKSTKFHNVPSQLDADETDEWEEFITNLIKPSELSQDNLDEWNELIDSRIINKGSMPIGSVVMWGLDISKIPDGFVPCDGRTLTRDGGYGDICDILGPAVNSFTVPDMRNRFPVCTGSDYNLGDTGGLSEVTLTSLQSGLRWHQIFVGPSGQKYETEYDEPFSHWHVYIGDDDIQCDTSPDAFNYKDWMAYLRNQGCQEPLITGGYYLNGNYNTDMYKRRFDRPDGLAVGQSLNPTTNHPRGYQGISWTYSYGQAFTSQERAGICQIKCDWSSNSNISWNNAKAGYYRTDGCSQHKHTLPTYTVNSQNAEDPHENRPPFYGINFIMKVKKS